MEQLPRPAPPLRTRLRRGLGRNLGEGSRVSRVLRRHRLIATLTLCGLIAACAWTAAFGIRFLDRQNHPWVDGWLPILIVIVPLRVLCALACGLHRGSWRYAAARDALPLLGAVLAGSALLAGGLAVTGWPRVGWSVLIIDAQVCAAMMAGVRYAVRFGEEVFAVLTAATRRKVIVVGAGAAGHLTIRAMLERGRGAHWPVAILDDDPLKQGTTILGVPVVGPVALAPDVARRSGVAAIVLAVPGARSSDLYRMVRHCRAADVPLLTVPDLAQLRAGTRAVTNLTDFRPEDLLARRPVVGEDAARLRRFLCGRRVLVTGAAGSIGSELCRQIVELGAARLVCLDKDENGLFRLDHELQALARATRHVPFLGDVKDSARLARLFDEHAPEIVFHAAAYKHVPILQYHPTEAIRNNVGGTRNLVELADARGVETFVLISTDKAVRPTSVMGATKRIAEHLVRARSRASATRFCAIRFGNVLGSNGSVLELFLSQIRAGRPVTVTHPRMERFFMTIGEAVHLVLAAGALATGGETFIVDMGDPVEVDQLARQLIRLCGLEPDVDVPVVYTGLRPGEKLSEELWTGAESPGPTDHPGILVAPRGLFRMPGLDGKVSRLLAAAAAGDLDGCWTCLQLLVPSFQGRTNGEATVPPEVAPAPPREAQEVSA